MGGGGGSPCFAKAGRQGNKRKRLLEGQSFWLDNGFLSFRVQRWNSSGMGRWAWVD